MRGSPVVVVLRLVAVLVDGDVAVLAARLVDDEEVGARLVVILAAVAAVDHDFGVVVVVLRVPAHGCLLMDWWMEYNFLFYRCKTKDRSFPLSMFVISK